MSYNETATIVTPTLKALNAIPGVLAYRVFTGTARVRGGVIHGAPKGTPDIACIVNGKPLFLEAKLPTEKPSEGQCVMRDRIARCGATWALISSVPEALSVVRRMMGVRL